MRRAARISAAAHLRAMRACRVGMREYEIEAELLHEFRRQGAQSPAYPSIVAAGANACVLHYPAGSAEARDGDLVLIDAACEVEGYAADVTRTFPANGRFGAEQRAVYEVVLTAQRAAIDAVRAGHDFNAPHEAATRVLTQGLIDLGLLAGSLDGALESKAYRQFFMHRTGHWLGLDVHDVGHYRDPAVARGDAAERPWRTLVPGMVTTVEPGLYIRPAPDVDERFHHIGIRIEDDVAVTAGGCEVLSADAPKTVADVEAVMRS
jgi:Xaa-Pro aminopeptidase